MDKDIEKCSKYKENCDIQIIVLWFNIHTHTR